jgi:hypothetical protein
VKKTLVATIAASAFVLVSSASAALVPGVYDPGNTGCPKASFADGWLHLEKNCATTTNAAAGADITGVTGTFESASFTLKTSSQCQGGSPRFDIVTPTGTFVLGCNNVTPTMNADGTATYTFTAATLAAAGNQVPVPTGTITQADVLIDVQGTADLTNITLNGVKQVPEATKPPKSGHGAAAMCKKGGWKALGYRNQGQCVKAKVHERNAARRHTGHH